MSSHFTIIIVICWFQQAKDCGGPPQKSNNKTKKLRN